MTPAILIGGLIFSGIGFVAFTYGRKQGLLKTSIIGVVLMLYPYFVGDAVWLYVIGLLLTVCLFIFKD
jgi:hypothetical protein